MRPIIEGMIIPARCVSSRGKGEWSLPAEWLSNSSDLQGRVTGAVQRALHSLSEPARARRLRQVLVALFALWAVLALVRLVWALFPAAPAPAQVDGAVVNPVAVSTASASSSSVDIERMMAWHLFGKAGVQQPEVVAKLRLKLQARLRLSN